MILFLYTFKYNNKKLAKHTHAAHTQHKYRRHVDPLQKTPRDDCG